MSRKPPRVRSGDRFPLDWDSIRSKYNCVFITKKGVAFSFRSKRDILRWPFRVLHRLGRVDAECAGIWFRPVDQEVRALAKRLSFTLHNVSPEIAEALSLESWRSYYHGEMLKSDRASFTRPMSMYASGYVEVLIQTIALREQTNRETFSALTRQFTTMGETGPVSIDRIVAIIENSSTHSLNAIANYGRSHDSFLEAATQVDLPNVDSQSHLLFMAQTAILALATRGISAPCYPREIDEILDQLCSIAQQEVASSRYDDMLPWICIDD
jgi:hypothetical protein